MYRVAILILITMLAYGIGWAQDHEYLRPLLKGKNKLVDVMRIVDDHFNSPDTRKRLGEDMTNRYIKQWKRFEWYMESRLGPNGEFVNINKELEKVVAQMKGNQFAQSTTLQSTLEPNSVAGTWSSLGPTSTTGGLGRVDRIAFHPSDPDIVYAGSSGGGLWRTTNGGTSWTNLTPNIPSTGISGIEIDPNNANHIFILTGDGDSWDFGGLVADYGYARFSIGVLETTDGGATWKKTGEFPDTAQFIVGFALAMDPNNNNVLLAATDSGLYRTANGGTTWTNVLRLKCTDVLFKPTGTTAYAITRDDDSDGFFWRSTDGGVTWDSTSGTNSLLVNAGRCKLGVTPANSNLVYILGGAATGLGQYAGTFRSTTSGTNFSLRSNTPNIVGRASNDNFSQSGYDLSLAVKPTNQNMVITGAVKTYRNASGGLTNNWVDIDNTHADIHELKYNPLDDKLWAATDGGMYYSTDDGTNWVVAYNSMSVSQIYHMDVRPSNYQQLLIGLQDNGIKYKATGAFDYDHISGADGFFVGYDAASDSIFYGVTNRSINKFTGVDGANQSNISPAGQLDDFFPSLGVHTVNGNTLMISADSFWRTTNGGASWNVTPNLNGKWYIRTCPSNGNRVYMAGRPSGFSTGILRRSDDGGVSWNNTLSDNPGFPSTTQRITCINVDPTNSLRVWVTFGGFEDGVKVYYSSDGGDNWVNRTGTLPNLPVNSIALDNANNAYVGTDIGVYYRGANMNSWVPFYNNLPYVPVTDLVISQAESRIRASTFGRGVWTSDLYTSCTDSINIAGTLEGQEFYEASSFISATAVLQASEGTKVIMRAGDGLQFSPGFIAYATTQFAARIGDCGTGNLGDLFLRDSGSSLIVSSPVQFYYPVNGRKAAVEINSSQRNQTSVNVHVLKEGEVKLVLKDVLGQIIKEFPVPQSTPGDWAATLSIPELANGMYYMHVYHNERWEHMQELEIGSRTISK